MKLTNKQRIFIIAALLMLFGVGFYFGDEARLFGTNYFLIGLRYDNFLLITFIMLIAGVVSVFSIIKKGLRNSFNSFWAKHKGLILFLLISSAIMGTGAGYEDNHPRVWNVKLFNIKPENSEATNTTNATTLMNAVVAVQGGTIYFPYADSPYKVRLIIPDISNFNNLTAIRILGETPPAMNFGTAGVATLSTKGVILKSSSITSGDAVIKVTGDAINTFSALTLYLENLDIRTYNRTKISGVLADSAAQLIMRNCFVNTNTYSVQAAQPIAGSKGVSTPLINNGALSHLDNVAVSGFHTGIDINEHVNGIVVNVFACDTALNFNNSYQSIAFARVDLARNRWGIVGTGASSLNPAISIANLNIEHADSAFQTVDSTKWQVTQADVYDPSNYIKGIAYWWSTAGQTGTHGVFTKVGGDSLNTYQLNNTAFFVRNKPNAVTGANIFSGINTFSAFQRFTGNLYANKIGIGDSAFAVPLSISYSSGSGIKVTNTTASGNATVDLFNSTGGLGQIFKAGSTSTGYKNIAANDLGIYAGTGNLSLISDTGNINFNAGGSSTAVMTLSNAGALRIRNYGVGTFTGTAAKTLAVDALGNVIEIASTSPWTISGSNIYYTTGKVSIGSTSAVSPLYIESAGGTATGLSIKATGSGQYADIDFINNSGTVVAQFLNTNSGFSSGMFTGNSTYLANYNTSGALALIAGGSSGIVQFATGGTAAINERMRIDASGNVLVGTTTTLASSKLTVTSTTQGILPPRMTTTQRNAISSPAEGLMVYDTDLHKLYVYDGTTWQAAW